MEILKYIVVKGAKILYKQKILFFVTVCCSVLYLIITFFILGNEKFMEGVVWLVVALIIFLALIWFAYTIFKIPQTVKDIKNQDIVKHYMAIFDSIGFKALSGECPLYSGEDETEYIKCVIFRTKIPLKEWENKKPLLETYFNAEILRFEHYQDNKNLVMVHMVKEPLPEYIVWDDGKHMPKSSRILNLGRSYEDYAIIDLNKNAHVFIAGETGSGKSNIIKSLIYQCLVKKHEVRLIDFKRGVSFAIFEPMLKIYSDHETAASELEKLVNETNRRLDLFKQEKVEELNEYNMRVHSNKELRRIVVFIDELAELVKTSDKETNKAVISYLETLTRISRATGIHLIMGIQRPDSTVITGQIKNNISLRICGRFVDPEPSRIMLGNDMASNLPQIKGRFIYKDDNYYQFQAIKISRENMTSLDDLENEFLTESVNAMHELMNLVGERMRLQKLQAEEQEQTLEEVEEQQPTYKEPNQELPLKNNSDIEFNFDDIQL